MKGPGCCGLSRCAWKPPLTSSSLHDLKQWKQQKLNSLIPGLMNGFGFCATRQENKCVTIDSRGRQSRVLQEVDSLRLEVEFSVAETFFHSSNFH